MSGSGRKALTLCTRVVWMPSRMSGSGRVALRDIREWSGGPLGCPGVVGRPYGMFGSIRKVLLDIRDCWGCPPECQ